MDYGNTKITSIRLYPRRRNVAAQVVEEELKTVTYATPPMEERRKKKKKKYRPKKIIRYSLSVGFIFPLFTSCLQAFSYLASVGAKTQPVNLKLMQYSLELWSAKMAVGAGTKFACFMAGGEHSGKKVNCFIEIFK